MNRFSNSERLRGLMLVLVALCAISSLISVFPAFSAHDMDEPAKMLVKLNDAWSAAAATRDVEKVAAFYAEDAIACPPNEPIAVGKAAAKRVWAAYFAEPSFAISWKTVHAEVAQSGDLGFTSGTYEASYDGPDGHVIHEKGKYLCTWKKQSDGSWKAIHDMWNTDSR